MAVCLDPESGALPSPHLYGGKTRDGEGLREVFAARYDVLAATGRCIAELEGHVGRINDLAAIPNAPQVITASADGRIVLWDIFTGEILAELTGDGREDIIGFGNAGVWIARSPL